MSDDDAHWRAGLAQIRAKNILHLIRLFEDGDIGISRALDAIADEAQAILDQTDPTPTEGDAA
jgi:hypothetical protein